MPWFRGGHFDVNRHAIDVLRKSAFSNYLQGKREQFFMVHPRTRVRHCEKNRKIGQ